MIPIRKHLSHKVDIYELGVKFKLCHTNSIGMGDIAYRSRHKLRRKSAKGWEMGKRRIVYEIHERGSHNLIFFGTPKITFIMECKVIY